MPNYFAGLEIAFEAALARGAEGAAECASGLGRDAEGGLVAGRDDDGLNADAVAAAEKKLADAIVRALFVGVVGPCGDVLTLGKFFAKGGRNVGHRVPGNGATLLEPLPDLLGTEGGLAELRACGFPFGRKEAPGQGLQRLRWRRWRLRCRSGRRLWRLLGDDRRFYNFFLNGRHGCSSFLRPELVRELGRDADLERLEAVGQNRPAAVERLFKGNVYC